MRGAGLWGGATHPPLTPTGQVIRGSFNVFKTGSVSDVVRGGNNNTFQAGATCVAAG